MPERIVYAISTLSTQDPSNGVILHLIGGEAWAADDPFVATRPDLFSDVPPSIRRTAPAPAPVETASKAPGERRNAKRP